MTHRLWRQRLTKSLNASAAFVSSLVESVTPGSSCIADTGFDAQIEETLYAADLFVGRYRWEIIDTDQTPSWGDINTSQPSFWDEIAANSTPGWTNVTNNPGTSWTNVGTSSNPNWQLVDTGN